MKKFIIALIAIFSFIAIALIAIMIILMNNVMPFTKTTLVNSQNIPLDNIDTISIETTLDDILFYTSDTDELIIKEYLSFTPRQDQLADIKENANCLTIKSDRRVFFNSGFFKISHISRIEVYIPTDYDGNLSAITSSGCIDMNQSLTLASFSASSKSGNIFINEVSADTIRFISSSGVIQSNLIHSMSTFEASSKSGDIKLNEVYADENNISSSSGSISLENIEGISVISSTSGDIDILNSLGDNTVTAMSGSINIGNSEGLLDVRSSSGNLKIKALSGGGFYETKSGAITLDYGEANPIHIDDLTVSASSGDVSLLLPSDLYFNFAASTSSGDIRTPFEDILNYNKKGNQATGTIGNSPEVTIRVDTMSGMIQVKQN